MTPESPPGNGKGACDSARFLVTEEKYKRDNTNHSFASQDGSDLRQ
jgi:hypothetical protein